jgi:S1-C subfamily serine protease
VRNTLATLQRSVLQQQEYLSQVQKEREELQRSYNETLDERTRITAERDQLSKQLADSAGSSAVIEQLRNAEKRLQKLEVERNASRRIVEQYTPSVALLHVVVNFRHIESGKAVTVGRNAQGENTQALTLELEGGGPELRLDFLGTAFVAGKDGLLLTNHHVAEPWWQNAEIKPLLAQGVRPVITSMHAYFPGLTIPLSASTVQVSQAADVSAVRVADLPRSISALPLASNTETVNGGDAIILIGYPTALAGILARVDEKTATEFMSSPRDPDTLLRELAKRRLIRPLSTQGHIGDVRPDRLVYDAQTTSGGSGGPVIDLNGKVVGVNYAILSGFAGASFAVPAHNARELVSKSR